jgi:hypothetical protein
MIVRTLVREPVLRKLPPPDAPGVKGGQGVVTAKRASIKMAENRK